MLRKYLLATIIAVPCSLPSTAAVSCPAEISDQEIIEMMLKRQLHGEGLPEVLREALLDAACLDDEKNFPHLLGTIEASGSYGWKAFDVHVVEDDSLSIEEISPDSLGVTTRVIFSVSAKRVEAENGFSRLRDSMQVMISTEEVRGHAECGSVLDWPSRFYVIESCLKD